MLDREGLQVAYLGVALAHYLDLESGDILDLPLDEEPPSPPDRFLRIPTRTPETEEHDRRIFLDVKHARPLREALESVVDDPAAFRQMLSTDRMVERAFFLFKNERATAAIEEWIAENGLS